MNLTTSHPFIKWFADTTIALRPVKGRKIGICGQAPSDYPEFAKFLVEQDIDNISLKTTLAILETETGPKKA